MSGQALVIDTPEMAQLPASKSAQIRSTFLPLADLVESFEKDYAEVLTLAELGITHELSARARRLRLDIAKVRTDAERARKALKEEYLLAGRAIDGTNNILKWAISQKEEALERIEKHEEIQEAARVAALQAERAAALAPFVADAAERELASMAPDVWDAYLATKQREHQDRAAAELRAAQDRARQAEERRAEIVEAARVRAERDQLAREARERQQRQELEAEEQRRTERQEAAAAARAARAPTRKRLLAWVDAFALPDLPGDDHATAQEIRRRFEQFHVWARGKAGEL